MQLILKNPEQAHHVITRIWNDVKIKLLAGQSQVIEVRDADEFFLKQELEQHWNEEPKLEERIRQCSRCNKIKSITDFHKDKSKFDGYRPDCKVCNTERVINKYKTDIDFQNRVKQRVRDWSRENKEKKYLYNQSEERKEKKRISNKKYREKNKKALLIHGHNRRARLRNAIGKPSKNIIQILMIKQKGICTVCYKKLDDDYHLDHITPIYLGGSNEDSNLQLLHSKCNLKKNRFHPIDFMQKNGRLL